MSAICPECDSPIDVDEFDVDIGDELTCSECGSFLRVANDSPLEFEVADDDLDDEEEEEDEEEAEDGRGTDEDELDDSDDDEDDDRIDEDE
jgi:alpha-aminoadipate carrier protein LysW